MEQEKMVMLPQNAQEDEQEEPVSPGGRIVDTEQLSICIHIVIELEQQVDAAVANESALNVWMPKHPRLSCILKEDEKGNPKWVKTEVNLEEHIIFPKFREGLEYYDEMVEEYISDIHLHRLSKDRPLWEFRVLNYKTKRACATVIFTAHHLVGDGASLVSLMQSSPSSSSSSSSSSDPGGLSSLHISQPLITNQPSYEHFGIVRLWRILRCTLADLISDFWTFNVMTDTHSPLRVPPPQAMNLPRVFASSIFPIHDIKLVKEYVGGTVNDVFVGMVFDGIRRYIQTILTNSEEEVDVKSEMTKMRITVMALMNTRTDKSRQTLKEMTKSKSGAPWGNKWAFVAIRVPLEETFHPIDYVKTAKQIMDDKKMSRAALLTKKILNTLTMLKGPKVASSTVYNLMTKATLSVSNVAGPTEAVSAAGVTAKTACFSWSGVPQGLAITALSFADSIRIQVVGTKGYIDAVFLSQCLTDSFHDMKTQVMSNSNNKFS